MRHVLKIAFAIVGISGLTLAAARGDHNNSNSDNPRKATRTHSTSSARSSKKAQKNPREKSIKGKRRGTAARDRTRTRTRGAIEPENMIATPAVDLPRHENGSEEDVASDEDSTENLMGTADNDDKDGGGQ